MVWSLLLSSCSDVACVQDSTYKYYEVILVDIAHKVIRQVCIHPLATPPTKVATCCRTLGHSECAIEQLMCLIHFAWEDDCECARQNPGCSWTHTDY